MQSKVLSRSTSKRKKIKYKRGFRGYAAKASDCFMIKPYFFIPIAISTALYAPLYSPMELLI